MERCVLDGQSASPSHRLCLKGEGILSSKSRAWWPASKGPVPGRHCQFVRCDVRWRLGSVVMTAARAACAGMTEPPRFRRPDVRTGSPCPSNGTSSQPLYCEGWGKYRGGSLVTCEMRKTSVRGVRVGVLDCRPSLYCEVCSLTCEVGNDGEGVSTVL